MVCELFIAGSNVSKDKIFLSRRDIKCALNEHLNFIFKSLHSDDAARTTAIRTVPMQLGVSTKSSTLNGL